MTEKPLINILIRTSNRPRHFKRAYDSIKMQTYKNIKLIVSKDRPVDYLPEEANAIDVTPNKNHSFYWNLYCNELKKEVTEGWFFFLDDDDFLISNNALEKITDHLADPEIAIICQFQRWGTKKPSDQEIREQKIIRGRIGMPCIFLHHSKKHLANFDGKPAADFRFIESIARALPVKFVPLVVVKAIVKSNGKSEPKF